ncbi:hypothetical protein NFI96_024461, partial [Prochilodus magdalenae]
MKVITATLPLLLLVLFCWTSSTVSSFWASNVERIRHVGPDFVVCANTIPNTFHVTVRRTIYASLKRTLEEPSGTVESACVIRLTLRQEEVTDRLDSPAPPLLNETLYALRSDWLLFRLRPIGEERAAASDGKRNGRYGLTLLSLCRLEMADDEDKAILQRRFEAAVKVMRSLPEDGTFEPSDDMLVMFYSYYKQATVGPCHTTRPNAWDSLGKAKWEAWKALGDMTTEQAMTEYIQEIQLILETMPVTEEVAELLDELEPFYEVVESEDDDVTVEPGMLAIEANRSDEEDEEEEADEDLDGFDQVEDGEDDMDVEDSSEELDRPVVVKNDVRGRLLVCNGDVDTHSVSSLTNGTHSSLNTEEDEEELACSRGNSLDSPHLYTCTDHITDDVGEQRQPSDGTPDSDVYSDSVEHPGASESDINEGPRGFMSVCHGLRWSLQGSGVSRVGLAGPEASKAKRPEEPGGSQDGNQQETPLPNPAAAGPVQSERLSVSSRGVSGCSLTGAHAVGDAVGTLSRHEVAQRVDASPVVNKCGVNTQIAAALSRLQDDMQNVLQRLNTLETQAAAQASETPSVLTRIPVETFPSECDPDAGLVKK